MGTNLDIPDYLPTAQEPLLKDIVVPEYFNTLENWPMCQSEIRDQARCGSCWAVAAAEAFEDRICIRCNGTHKAKIGAQELVSCNYASFGCHGGYPWAAWEYYALFGSVTEECFPYTSGKGDSGSCPFFTFLMKKCPNKEVKYQSYKIHYVNILMGEK